MKRKLVAALAAVAFCLPGAAFAASIQSQIDALQAQIDAIQPIPGPEGPAGPAGGGSGGVFQLTVSTAETDGIISTAEWNNECEAMGGRAATTKDLLSLSWDTSAFVDEPESWVRPYIVAAHLTSSTLVDITGIFGTTPKIACTPDFSTPWSTNTTGSSGFLASGGGVRIESCAEIHPVTCVVPVP